jgi:hypothetical protein
MLDFPSVYEDIVARAGGEQSTAEDVLKVERSMTIVLQRWANKRYPTWRVKQATVTATGYSPAIALPDDLDDVLQASLVDGGTLSRIPSSRYMQIATKDQQGAPGQFWLNRAEPPVLMVHPVGTRGTAHRIELWYAALPPQWDRGRPGSDVVPGRWLEALILGCAHDLAAKRPTAGGGYDEELIARLKGESAVAEETALNADRDRSRFTYRIRA